MVDDNELEQAARRPRCRRPGRRREGARLSGRHAAPTTCKILPPPPKDRQSGLRLTERARRLWREMMKRNLCDAGDCRALALPIAGYATLLHDGGTAVPVRPRRREDHREAGRQSQRERTERPSSSRSPSEAGKRRRPTTKAERRDVATDAARRTSTPPKPRAQRRPGPEQDPDGMRQPRRARGCDQSGGVRRARSRPATAGLAPTRASRAMPGTGGRIAN